MHFFQALEILEFGRDIIIEKPIFISSDEVKKICQTVNFDKNIVLEGFMYRYTKMYTEFIKYWQKNKNKIKRLKCVFFIPKIPKGTYRDNIHITSSCLYDMGCYGLSLINDMGLDLHDIHIVSYVEKKAKLLKLSLKGIVENISIEINFGKSKNYKNYVETFSADGKKITFSPFFYGREGEKTIIKFEESEQFSRFLDYNAFQKMFNLNLHHLRLTQRKRFEKILNVTKKLENLAIQFELMKT